MNEFMNIVISWVGGIGVIVMAIGWMVKTIYNSINERSSKKLSARLDRELAKQKSEFDKEIEQIRTENERGTYINNRQFDKEYEVLLETYSKLDNAIEDLMLVDESVTVVRNEVTQEERRRCYLKMMVKSCNEFREYFRRNCISMSKDIFEKLKKINTGMGSTIYKYSRTYEMDNPEDSIPIELAELTANTSFVDLRRYFWNEREEVREMIYSHLNSRKERPY